MTSLIDGIFPEDPKMKMMKELEAASTSTVAAVFKHDQLVALHGEFRTGSRNLQVAAREFLQAWAELFGFSPNNEVKLSKTKNKPREAEARVVHFEYASGRTPWFEAGVEVSFDAENRIRSIFARIPTSEPRESKNLNPKIAIETIQAQFPDEPGRTITLKPRTVIFDPSTIGESGKPYPMFEFTVPGEQGPAVLLVSPDGETVIPVGTRPESIPFNTPLPRYHLNPTTRVPDFITFAPTGLLLPEATTGDPTAVAFALFQRYPTLFGTGAPAMQLEVVDILSAAFPEQPSTTVILRQLYGGIPVYGCQLRVHLTASLAIRSITGVYYRDPEVATIPRLNPLLAYQAAFGAWAANGGPEQPGLPGPGSGELVILPTTLTQNGGPRNHLTWHFTFPDQHLFISAETGSLVFRISRFEEATRVRDTNRQNLTDKGGNPLRYRNGSVLQFVDGVAQVAIPDLDMEAQQTADSIQVVLNFWRLFGRNGWDGYGADIVAYIDLKFKNNAASIDGELLFGTGMAAPDVIAHELTHSLIRATSGLVYIDESGAANESYADVFGSLIFPDNPETSWILLEQTATSRRNLRNPNLSIPDPQPRTYSDYFPATGDGGVHINSGILNRAAVLLADGEKGSGHNGIGRSRLAKLYYYTLVHYLHPWAMFIDVLHSTYDLAQWLAEDGRAGTPLPALGGAAPPIFDQAVTDEVLWAFDRVALNMRLTVGWFNLPGKAITDQPLFAGVILPAGETVRDVIVRGRHLSAHVPVLTSLLVKATGPTTDNLSSEGFTLSINSNQIGTNSPESLLRIESPNLIPLEIAPFYEVNPAPMPPGTTTPPPLPIRIQDSSAVGNWCDFPFCGRRYRDDIYITESLPAGCVVVDMELILLGRNYQPSGGVGGTSGTTRFGLPAADGGGFGAEIVLATLGGQGLYVIVNSWHDAFKMVRYKLRYFIQGNSCPLPPMSRIGSLR